MGPYTRRRKETTTQAAKLDTGAIIQVAKNTLRPGEIGTAHAYIVRQHFDSEHNDKFTGWTLMEIIPTASLETMRPRPSFTYNLPIDGEMGLPLGPNRTLVAYSIINPPRIVTAQDNELTKCVGGLAIDVSEKFLTRYNDYHLDTQAAGYIRGSDLSLIVDPVRQASLELRRGGDDEKPKGPAKPGVKRTARTGTHGALQGNVVDLSLENAQKHYGLATSIVDAFKDKVGTLMEALNLRPEELAKTLAQPKDITLIEAFKKGFLKEAWVVHALERPSKQSDQEPVTTLSAAAELAINNPDQLNKFGGLGGTDMVDKMGKAILQAHKRAARAQATKPELNTDAEKSLKDTLQNFKNDYGYDRNDARKIGTWYKPK